MTLVDMFASLEEQGVYPSDNNDFELFFPDGRPVVSVWVTDQGIFLSDGVDE